MWECLVKIWAWFGVNAGQVQIVIAIVALILAYVVYRKVLKQIEISNTQTLIANEQAIVANGQAVKNNQQVEKLNSERLFEVKLRLITTINEQLIMLSTVEAEYSIAKSRIDHLLILVTGKDLDILNMVSELKFMYSERTLENTKVFNSFRVYLESILDDLNNKGLKLNLGMLEDKLGEIILQNKKINIAQIEHNTLYINLENLKDIAHKRYL